MPHAKKMFFVEKHFFRLYEVYKKVVVSENMYFLLQNPETMLKSIFFQAAMLAPRVYSPNSKEIVQNCL